MTPDQLQTARAAQWHQNASPLLTLDDAQAWLDRQGLCLFLPRHAQLPSPAPSFVEACFGQTTATPPRAAIETASELMTRLVKERHAVPLNLFGTLSEQPDFLATPETLPWIASVRGDRDWKSAPAGRTSPLLMEIWKLLEKKGALEVAEICSTLGREVTETAVLRGLVELWGSLRVVPTYEQGGATVWNLLKADYPKQLAAGANTSQVTALSALISFYLQSAVAATGEEIEVFLSPLTARSRIREVVHGLTATRQIDTVALGTQTLLHNAGGLPEFAVPPEAETETPTETADSETLPTEARPQRTAFDRRPPRPVRPVRKDAEKDTQEDRPAFRRPAAADRPAVRNPRGDRPFPPKDRGERLGERPGYRPGPKRFAAGNQGSRPARPQREGAAGGFQRPPFGKRPFPAHPRSEEAGSESRPYRKPFDRPRPAREQGEGQERRPFPSKKPFGARPGKPAGKFGPKPGGFRPGVKPAGSFGNDRPQREGSGGGFERPTFGKRFGAPRPPSEDGGSAPRKPFSGERKSFGDKKPFTPRSGKFGGKPGSRPYPKRGEGRASRPPAGPREGRGEGGERPPFRRTPPRGEDRPRREASDGGFQRPSFGKRFGAPRPPREGGERGPGKPFTGERKPFSDKRKSFGDKPRFAPKSSGPKSSGPDRSGPAQSGSDRPRPDRQTSGRPAGGADGGERTSSRPPSRLSKPGSGFRSGSGFKSGPGSRPGGRPGGRSGFGAKRPPQGGKPFPRPGARKPGPPKPGPRKPRNEDRSE